MSMISWRQSKINIIKYVLFETQNAVTAQKMKFSMKDLFIFCAVYIIDQTSIKYWNFFKEHVSYNFIKFFFGSRLNEVVNKYLSAWLSGFYNLLFSAS